jgi:D-3-phosphoglycerate dehydrogenase
MTARVVITDYTFPELAQERAAALGAGASFEAYQVKSDGELAELINDADVVAVQFATFGPLSCAAVKRGATIIRYGVGYDNIDLVAAKAADLKVGYVPDYCVDEVAEHTCAAAHTIAQTDNA